MNMRKKMGLFITLITLFSITAIAQVTSSTITGIVKNSVGEILAGSTIKLTHTPTGTVYQTSTNKEGRYTLVNLIPGGPYAIEISNVGFASFTDPNINLPLGESTPVDASLSTTANVLTEVVVSSTGISRKKTGASTSISKAQIAALPTLSRSIQDYTRLTPQANGNSFGGMSNRFNNITIDGAVNNDVFGLSGSGTPGGSAATTPISLDAISEIQVVLAPYDVSYGNFTGGGINAVTRSGSNKFEGSVYYFGRNQSTTGNDPLTDKKTATFSDKQYGFRLGGPIIKNKLFFFINGEMARKNSPTIFNAGDSNAVLTTAEAQRLVDTMKTKYNYDPGTFGAFDAQTQSDKAFARIDWNIDAKHRLTLRHNYIKAYDDNNSRSTGLFRFGNNTYRFSNKQHITVAELRSRFNSKFSNNLIIGRHEIRDSRSIYGDLFPSIEINKSSNQVIQLGSERSSTANQLDQDIFEITDNFKIFAGKHTLTIGTHNEFFKFRNLFMNNANGRWRFASLNDFYANFPRNFDVSYSANKTSDSLPAARFSASQLGLYVQDEIQTSPNFRITIGIRADMPIINSTPARNPIVDSTFGGKYNTSFIPNKQILLAPRVGFNYDINGNRSSVLRGGVGIFTGRVPFVWISNQFGGTGLLQKTTAQFDNTNTPANEINGGNGFNPNVSAQSSIGGSGSTFETNLIDKKFKIPQVFRANVGWDRKLPGNINLTLEAIFSKTINNVLYQDINLKDPIGTVDSTFNHGYDYRDAYAASSSARRKNPSITNAYLTTNTNKGYALNLGFTVSKTTKWFFGQVGYNYNVAKDVNSGASSTAGSNWGFVQMVNDPNNPELATSNYQLKHRITGAFALNFNYSKYTKTSLSFFYNGNSGQPFTYLVFGDLNNDGSNGNDLLYVPAAAAEIKFVDRLNSSGVLVSTAAQQMADFMNFIANDKYLSSRKGQYTERNGAKTPWEHVVDMRIAQDFVLNVGGNKHDLQLTFDIFNLTNLLNKEWGRQYFVNNQAYSILSTINRTPATSGRGYNFTPGEPWTTSFGSRWQGQFGIRYSFN